MSIVRRKMNQNYTVVPNEPVLDDRLSFDALGLLTYLLSRPDNWCVNLNQLRGRGGIGRDKIQRIMRELIDTDYVVRESQRDGKSHRFGGKVYTVYDCPQSAVSGPQLENPAMAPKCDIPAAAEFPVPGKPVAGKPGHIVNTDYSNSLRGSSEPDGSGAEAPPTISKLIWVEGLALIAPHINQPGDTNRKLIGKWIARASTDTGKSKLLSIIRAAKAAGTHDPVSYIAKAVNEKWPRPPSPATFTPEKWHSIIATAIRHGRWSTDWGPAPSRRGCMLPIELITSELIEAVQKTSLVGLGQRQAS